MTPNVAVIPPIVRQHVESAAFLWVQRRRMFRDPAMTTIQLGRMDLRLNAHLSACLASGDAAVDAAMRHFGDYPYAGEIFTLLVLCLFNGRDSTPEAVARISQSEKAEWGGASGALALVGAEPLKPFMKFWSQSAEPFVKWLALTAFSHYRSIPRELLIKYLADSDPLVRARALRLLGELGELDLATIAIEALDSPEEAGQNFFAARSALLLGHKSEALQVLRPIACATGPYADDALELVVIADRTPECRKWLGKLFQNEERRGPAVAIAGAIDDPDVTEWLLTKCSDPDFAAAATAALRGILRFDLDNTTALESDPNEMGPAFAGRGDGPWAVADRVRKAITEQTEDTTYVTLPNLRRKALTESLQNPGTPLREWRCRMPFPAWS